METIQLLHVFLITTSKLDKNTCIIAKDSLIEYEKQGLLLR